MQRVSLAKTHQRGFTLVETLVAITILMITLVAFMSLARIGISMTVFSAERVTAFYLAQDAMQFMVNLHYADIREKMNNFNDYIISTCQGGPSKAGCTIDTAHLGQTLSARIVACGSTCPVLNYDNAAAQKVYTYSSGSLSLFRRTIVAVPQNGYETRVIVTVSWVEEGGSTRSVSLERHFFSIQNLL